MNAENKKFPESGLDLQQIPFFFPFL